MHGRRRRGALLVRPRRLARGTARGPRRRPRRGEGGAREEPVADLRLAAPARAHLRLAGQALRPARRGRAPPQPGAPSPSPKPKPDTIPNPNPKRNPNRCASFASCCWACRCPSPTWTPPPSSPRCGPRCRPVRVRGSPKPYPDSNPGPNPNQVQAALQTMPPVFDPLTSRLKPWIDVHLLTRQLDRHNGVARCFGPNCVIS